MKQYYYINSQGTQTGPCSLEEISRAGIAPSTKVWHEGLADWTPASNILEFQSFIGSAVPPPFEQPLPPKPDTYLVWSILTTLLCFFPFGVVAIVYSVKADSYWASKQWGEAYKAANKAKKWSIYSAVALPVFLIIYLFIVMFAIGTAAAFDGAI